MKAFAQFGEMLFADAAEHHGDENHHGAEVDPLAQEPHGNRRAARAAPLNVTAETEALRVLGFQLGWRPSAWLARVVGRV